MLFICTINSVVRRVRLDIAVPRLPDGGDLVYGPEDAPPELQTRFPEQV